VTTYCTKLGSPVFTCSLDTEVAFDDVPDVLFKKVVGVIPDYGWLMLIGGYTNITVQIKWYSGLNKPFKLCKGTYRGGLSLAFAFQFIVPRFG